MSKRTFTRSILPLAVILSLGLAGCGTVHDTVYLSNLEVEGPIEQPPVHLTDHPAKGDFHITPRFSYNRNTELQSRLNGPSYYDTIGSVGKNFRWSMPSAQYGLDVDWMVSDHLALNLGLSFADMQGGRNYTGGNVGIGFPFTGSSASLRMDVGIQWQTISYDAYSVLVRETIPFFSSGTTTDVYYFHDIGRTTPWNLYGTITVNSVMSGPVNLFGSISISRQGVAGFQPEHSRVTGPFVDYSYTDTRADQTAMFLMFTPGLSFSVSPSVRLLTGVRLMAEAAVDNASSGFIAPMAQIDFKP